MTQKKNIASSAKVQKASSPTKKITGKETPPPVTESKKKVSKALPPSSTKKSLEAAPKPGSKHTPIVFSMEDVQSYLSTRKDKDVEKEKVVQTPQPSFESPLLKAKDFSQEKRVYGAASLTDILGASFVKKGTATSHVLRDESKISPKLMKHYNKLVTLQQRVKQGFSSHTKDTIKETSEKDGSQDFADAASENASLNFALNVVSNEKELLEEIEAAIDRIIDGTYGICEITGKPIPEERLAAVPFTRFSLEGQKKYEQDRRRQKNQNTDMHLAEDAPIAFAEDDVEG